VIPVRSSSDLPVLKRLWYFLTDFFVIVIIALPRMVCNFYGDSLIRKLTLSSDISATLVLHFWENADQFPAQIAGFVWRFWHLCSTICMLVLCSYSAWWTVRFFSCKIVGKMFLIIQAGWRNNASYKVV
jgi:hypothetical protein